MILQFTVYTRVNNKFPSLNEYIKAERIRLNSGGKFMTKGAVMKRTWQGYIARQIYRDLKKQKITKPIVIHYHYFEPDAKRDLGNIHATFQKFCEDALQDVGTIPNDNQKWVKGFTADFQIDKKNPRIVVELEEI